LSGFGNLNLRGKGVTPVHKMDLGGGKQGGEGAPQLLTRLAAGKTEKGKLEVTFWHVKGEPGKKKLK